MIFGNFATSFTTIEAMEIKFGNIGSSLGTRFLGKKLRLEIEESISNNDFVVFNFEGVNSISHSFSDECFAKILINTSLEDLKANTTFKNTNALIKKTIAFTIKERTSLLVTS